MTVTCKAIAEGAPLPPWYYGVAFVEFYTRQTVFYPIPWNYFIRAKRAVARQWNAWRAGSISPYDQRVLRMLGYWRRRAYSRGLDHGRDEGMRVMAALQSGKDR